MAMAARVRMIATTIISSMRVKPRWFPRLRRRFCQNRIMCLSLVEVELSLRDRSRRTRTGGGARLSTLERETARRSSRLRKIRCDESEQTRFERAGASAGGCTGCGRLGFGGVVDVDEPVEDLVAVELLVVLDAQGSEIAEVELGQPALGGREQQ